MHKWIVLTGFIGCIRIYKFDNGKEGIASKVVPFLYLAVKGESADIKMEIM